MSEAEQRRGLSMRTARIAVAASAALIIAATFAVAAIPSSDGTPVARATAGTDDALLRGGQAIPNAPATMFLKLDGIEGESADAQHAREIDIHSFRFGVDHGTAQAGGSGGGGGGSRASRPRFSTVRFDKTYDRASPQLLQAAADGRRIRSAVVTFRREGADQQDFLTYTFSDVVVDEYVQGGRQEPPLLESVALDYAKVEVSYRRQNADGSLDAPITAGWDLGASRSP
jgi:type VI secretion system secreted protein Hcp